MTRLLVGLVVGATLLGCSGESVAPRSSTPASDEAVQLPPEAVAQIEALIAEKEARTPAQRKIASQLLYTRSGRFAAPGGKTKDSLFKNLTEIDAKGRVLVDVKAAVAPELLAEVEKLGGSVVSSSIAHNSVRAWIGLEKLEAFAENPSVQVVRPALQAATNRANAPRGGAKYRFVDRTERVAAVQKAVEASLKIPRLAAGAEAQIATGAATSEGVKAHGADRAHRYFDTTGAGVKIGVLSDSDDYLEQSIATGDLPADTVTLPGQDGRPGSGEGTAMMEIIHDVAPGAKLFFATAFTSPESFAENIRALRFQHHADIIVDDIIYYFESPYQDDIIAQAVADVVADGALYFSSAGNQGNYDDGTSGLWEGDFKPAGTLASLPSGYEVHDFRKGVISNRIENMGGPLVLHWSDPGSLDNPASSNDYDLFVLDSDLRNVAVAATDLQDGTGMAFEYLGYLIPPDFRVVVARKPGAKTRAIRLALFGGEFGIATSGASYGHNSAPGAFAVAAVDAAEAIDGVFTAGPTTPVELYSSDGNRRIFYDRDNQPLGGGVTFASGGGELRKTPAFAAADGVATTLPSLSGLNPFYGTSAAAPHAAAIAALLKSAVPGISSAKLRHALVEGALDIEGPGIERNSGAGIVSAMNSLQQAGAKPAAFLEAGTVTVTPTEGDALLPGGSGSISVQIVNNGGATASNVNAMLGSTSPYVTITTRSASYPNLAPGTAAANRTPFTFAVSPSTPCGARLDFTLTVIFSGRGPNPALFKFSVNVGRPGDRPTTFSYTGEEIQIPDGDRNGVDVPLAVEFPDVLSKVVFRIDGTDCTSDATVGVAHTWVGDLVFKLTSPGGQTVTLANQPGGALNGGNNFCQTVLDDAALTSIQAIRSGQAPFTGSFTPASPLTPFRGGSGNGTWTLNVSDNARLDTGVVRSFSLDLSGYTCEAAPQ